MGDSLLPTENDVWYLLRSYYKRHSVVRHQLESFNHFLTVLLPNIIKEVAEIRVAGAGTYEHVVTMCNVSIERPTVTDADGTERSLDPHVARLRSLTYASAVMVDVVHDIFDGDTHSERRLYRETCLCRIPVMLGCNACNTQYRENHHECQLDPGGYFIVNGIEKVMTGIEKLHHNTPYVFAVKQPSRFAYQCEIRSVHEKKLRSTSSLYIYITNTKRGATPQMIVELPFMTTTLPVFALFRLLGVSTRVEAMHLIMGTRDDADTRVLQSILDNDPTADMSTAELYEHVGREGTKETTSERRCRYIEHILNCEVLPHQGLTGDADVRRAKTLILGIMVRKLMRVYAGKLECDDRDHMATKRVDCAGTQFGLLFRQVLRMVQKSVSMQLYKMAGDHEKLAFTNMGNLIAGKKITQHFRYALATGNWGIMSMRGTTAQTGVAQQLSRMTSAATLALLRKVATPVARETKNPKPRQLHTSVWGLVCPMDTPEGGACGLTKSLAMMAHVRIGTPSEDIRDVLAAMRDEALLPALETTPAQRASGVPVLVNGAIHLYATSAERAHAVAAELRAMRRDGRVPFDTTVALTEFELSVETDPGCVLRPLFRVDQLHRVTSLLRHAGRYETLMEYLVSEGAVEYVDKQEELAFRVALSPYAEPPEGWGAFTHCELDPSLITGISGALIPFADFNQSPRNTYQCAMSKQALGVPCLNYPIRMDTILHVMAAPQRPLVATRMDELTGASEAPAGVNTLIAVMCYTGQNQEDSVIVNRAALDRGLFRSVKFHTYRDEEHQHGGADVERFKNVGKAAHVNGKRSSDYSNLTDNGIIAVGTRVKPDDVIISKTITTADPGEGTRRTVERDSSTVLKHEHGIVDSVLRVENHDGTHIVKVKIRTTRRPIVGDKVSSRMGQKGVIGAILAHEDMPFTEDGMVPDIIVNPHAIPSRMTIGQLTECILAILGTLTGQYGDGTMFRGTSLEHICEQLSLHGYDSHGCTTMYNGFTGEKFETKIFLGPTYYQRLKHMAADKDHARSRGPVLMLSRQPTEGRARDGGLRFGEMERDCLISHGATEFLRDRLLDNSDPSLLTVCGKCGLLAQPAARETTVRHREAYCHTCKTGEWVRDMQTPYSFRLLLQELQVMSVGVRFEF